eukprot:TRINITY_DN1450_c0_g1_i3.p1 TRINITY_DN1450_c0_g1~~TRINITY_DN1450_c0_g1_i3.p1  ORF type:complete len:493 (-),score=77.43 TRINITY_DN1450_c0_g1_i3:2005-3483(-)
MMFEKVENCPAFGRRRLATARLDGRANPRRSNWLWPLVATGLASAVLLTILFVEQANGTSIPDAVWAVAVAPMATFAALSLTAVQLVAGPVNKICLDAEDAKNGVGEAYMGLMKRVHTELEIMFKLLDKHRFGMVVTIDNLDRCSSKQIVNMLEAVHLLLQVPDAPVVAFLALDPRIIVAALEDQMGERMAQQVSGMEYLDKIIHLPFCIPPCETKHLYAYVKAMMVAGGLNHTDVTPAAPLSTPGPAQIRLQGVSHRVISTVGPATNSVGSSTQADLVKDQGPRFSENESGIAEEVLRQCRGVNITPRKLKRILNIYALQRAILHVAARPSTEEAIKDRAELLFRWIFLAELWPFRFACLMYVVGTITTVSLPAAEDGRELHHLYESSDGKSGLKTVLEHASSWREGEPGERYYRCHRLLALDGDDQRFVQLLKYNDKQLASRSAWFTMARVLNLHKYTINLNPALSVEVSKLMTCASCVDGIVSLKSPQG